MVTKSKNPFNILPFQTLTVDPPVIHPSLASPPAATILTHQPGLFSQKNRRSLDQLVNQLCAFVKPSHVVGIRLTDSMEIDEGMETIEALTHCIDRCWVAVTLLWDHRQDGTALVEPPKVLKFIEWVGPPGSLKKATQILKSFSKAGVWNHVSFSTEDFEDGDDTAIRFAVANPNIVHSWALPSSQSGGDDNRWQTLDTCYTNLSSYPALSGRPMWHFLPDLNQLQMYIDHYSFKQVLRWWFPDDTKAPITLGEHLQYHFVKPQALSTDRLEAICRLVEAGGSVDTRWVRHNLQRAFLIAYVTEMDQVVANSSLKHPRSEYIAALSENAGIDLSQFLERGYTSVRPEYRGMGIGTRLVEGLTSRAKGKKIFSLIGEDNFATQKIAKRNRTVKITTFYSQRAGKAMGVWMPESMLE